MTFSNRELELAGEYIRETGTTVFLTGKAGTGKTTFLHTLQEDCPKRLIVTAPTGVAAINAGGVTLHSFFQLPFGPFIPGSEHDRSRSHYRFSKDKINIIRSLDLLVIDEISMVRADLLDGVDAILRRYRRSSLPFGGVQLLMIGDLHQLPPVVKNDEWQLLSRYYESPFFFCSKALAATEMASIELKQIYRQADSAFIEILNQVRDNTLQPASLQQLNARVQPGFSPEDEEGYITLCTHNRNADRINQKKLAALTQKLHQYHAEIEGEFPDHTFPASPTLELKEGAQVMFIRNDASADKRFFNGKIGIITHIAGDTIRVRCKEDAESIEVEPATWENIEYTLNQETLEITEKKVGSFSQYPLRLAWAITIHKSQGLTFDKAVIDAQEAFAHGQVYVALSRCRTLEGMVLSAPLSSNVLKTDRAVLNFTRNSCRNSPSSADLYAAKTAYQQRLMLECFDFQSLKSLLRRMVFLIRNNDNVIQVSGVDNLETIEQLSQEHIFAVSNNFQRQLHSLFRKDLLPADDPVIQERLTKASEYFSEKIDSILTSFITRLQIESDNKELRKKITNTSKMLTEENRIKTAAVRCSKEQFSPSRYLRAISAAAIEAKKPLKKKAQMPSYTEADIAHPDLFLTLKKWRGQKADESGLAHFQVMHQKTLVQIAVNLPENLTALQRLKGIGKKLTERYGDEIIDIVNNYRTENKIEKISLPVSSTKETPDKPLTPAPDTKELTLELFNEGLTVSEIAEKRQLTLPTIEKHLAQHIENGKIAIDRLIAEKRMEKLLPQIKRNQARKLSEIKQALNVSATYGEIQFILAHLRRSSS